MNATILNLNVTLREEMLGMRSGNPDVATEFLKKKFGGEEKIPADVARTAEEEQELIEEGTEKGTTVFPRDAAGNPILFDYQLRGAIKDWIAGMLETGWKGKGGPGTKGWNPWNYKKHVDSCIFVRPRQIILHIPEGGEMGLCERPLRATTMKGDRVALARSETVPVGTTFAAEIHLLRPQLEVDVREIIEYGATYRGLGQWRNSGKGAFDYTLELKA